MKSTCTILLSILSAGIVMAQPSFTSIPSPANGTTVTAKSISYTGTDPASANGANVNWDYSVLDFSAATASTSTIHTDIAGSGHSASFPTASVYEQTAAGSQLYYQLSSTQQTLLGSVGSDGTLIVNTDPLTSLTVPFNYTETQSDTYAGDYVNSGYPVTRSGTISVKFDGYGTIKLPNETLTNIPRLKSVEDETQSIDVGGFDIIYEYITTSYTWSVPGEYSFRFSIITIETIVNGSSLGTVSKAYYRSAGTATGILGSTAVANATVFPQPAYDLVTVLAEHLEGSCLVSIYNLSGIAVLQQELIATDDALRVDVEQLKSGLYNMEINNGDKIYRQKLMVK
ncbi:MAG: hypothetical protein JWO58_3000 [Chitinophagaceae bacterium]|nr:hypothetical protein [Chitinophagaceae bacterium]